LIASRVASGLLNALIRTGSPWQEKLAVALDIQDSHWRFGLVFLNPDLIITEKAEKRT